LLAQSERQRLHRESRLAERLVRVQATLFNDITAAEQLLHPLPEKKEHDPIMQAKETKKVQRSAPMPQKEKTAVEVIPPNSGEVPAAKAEETLEGGVDNIAICDYELNRVRDRNALKDQELAQLKERLAAMETEFMNAIVKAEEEEDLVVLRGQNTELESRLAILHAENEKLKRQADALRYSDALCVDLQRQVDALSTNNDNIKRDKAALVLANEELKNQIASSDNKNNLEAQTALKNEGKNLEGLNAELESQLAELKMDNTQQKCLAMDLEGQLEALTLQLACLKKENTQEKCIVIDLEGQLEALTIQFACLKKVQEHTRTHAHTHTHTHTRARTHTHTHTRVLHPLLLIHMCLLPPPTPPHTFSRKHNNTQGNCDSRGRKCGA